MLKRLIGKEDSPDCVKLTRSQFTRLGADTAAMTEPASTAAFVIVLLLQCVGAGLDVDMNQLSAQLVHFIIHFMRSSNDKQS